jgi:hypothetical protein
VAVLADSPRNSWGFDAAAGADGSFLLLWNDRDGLLVRLLEADGGMGPEIVIASGDGGAEVPLEATVAADPRGGFVVLGQVAGEPLVLRRLDAAGRPAGPWRDVLPDPPGDVEEPRVSVGETGDLVVSWTGSAPDTLSAVLARWFDPSGAPRGPARVLGDLGSNGGHALTHVRGGDVVFAWESRSFGIDLSRYTAAGAPVSEDFLDLRTSDDVYQREHRVHLAPLAGGGAFFGWMAQGIADPYVSGVLLDPAGSVAGEVFRIGDFNFDGASEAHFASDGATGVLATWIAGGFERGVYARPLRAFIAGSVAADEPTVRVPEGGGAAEVTIRRNGFSEGAISVRYEARGGSAEAGRDFRRVAGTLSWADGDLSARTVEIPILQDAGLEPPEVIELALFEPTGGAVLEQPATSYVVIEDDDGFSAGGGAAVPLTAEQVACDRARLAGLLGRLELVVPHSGKDAGIDLSLTASGDFAGIAYTANGPTAEHHLAFSTDPEVSPLLLNPERPQLPAVALARNRVNSDLVPPGDGDTLEVRLRPTLGDGPADPAGLLVIDNVETGSASQVKPGRGLAALLAPCHQGALTERDEHVLRVLSKLVRLEADGADRSEIAIFRGEAIDSYRIDAYALAADGRALGRLAAEVTVGYDGTGALADGELRLLPPCAGGACTTLDGAGSLLLVRPTFSGEIRGPAPYAVSTPAGPGGDAVAVDWTDLLAGTTWRRPL